MRHPILPIATVLFLSLVVSEAPAEEAAPPATAEQALKVIDLSTIPLVSGSTDPLRRTPSSLTYQAAADVPGAYAVHRQQLLDQGWKEEPGYASPQSTSGSFTKNGFTVSLTAMQAGADGQSLVSLINHGNLDPRSLPAPAKSKLLYGGPQTAMHLCEASVDDTTREIADALQKAGWSPYGEAGDQHFFKQNAIRVSAFITTAPAQGGKTSLQYSVEQLSHDFPAPENVKGLQYDDGTAQLSFDTALSLQEIDAFYRQALASRGWRATLEAPVKVDSKDTLIFRDSAMNMITITVHEFDGLRRVRLILETKQQLDEQEERAKEAIKKRNEAAAAAEQSAKDNAVAIPRPKGASQVDAKATRIEFKLPTGQAKSAIDKLEKSLTDAGWKLEPSTRNAMVGTLQFSRNDQQLMIIYVDPGFIPAEVTISTTGVNLKLTD